MDKAVFETKEAEEAVADQTSRAFLTQLGIKNDTACERLIFEGYATLAQLKKVPPTYQQLRDFGFNTFQGNLISKEVEKVVVAGTNWYFPPEMQERVWKYTVQVKIDDGSEYTGILLYSMSSTPECQKRHLLVNLHSFRGCS